MSIIELVAVVAGLLSVYLTTRQSIWCWPVGLVQVVLFVWIFWEAKLYSDLLLHIVYVVLQIYGWWHWLQGRREQSLPVTRLTTVAALGWLGVAVVGSASLGQIMVEWTDAALPRWDAAIAVLSLIAQYLLARKVLENWLLWMVVDVLAIGVYSARELYLTAGLYGVFLVLCVVGWVEWRHTLRRRPPSVQRTPASAP